MAFNHILTRPIDRKGKRTWRDQRLGAVSPNQNRQARIVEVRVLYNGLEASTETLGLPE